MSHERRPSRNRRPAPTGRVPTPGEAPTRPDRLEVPEEGVRLNRYVARAGVTSRRKADDLIAGGHVAIDGKVVTELGTRVFPGQRVAVDGKPVLPQERTYILLNKPSDTITTTDDERGRQTVLDLVDLPEREKSGLFPVGRLDRDTLGVLLLTNDGALAHRLMHPRYRVDKLYTIVTREPVKPHELDMLARGVELDDGPAKADRVTFLDPSDHHAIGIGLHEGRNRQVRRMLEAIGHDVVRLERVGYAGLDTRGVRRGKWRLLLPHEVGRLRRLVRLK